MDTSRGAAVHVSHPESHMLPTTYLGRYLHFGNVVVRDGTSWKSANALSHQAKWLTVLQSAKGRTVFCARLFSVGSLGLPLIMPATYT